MHPDLRAAFAVAALLGCTVNELQQRLSAQEFGMWVVWMQNEEAGDAYRRVHHAEQLAASANGVLQRRDKRMFEPSDFVRPAWQNDTDVSPTETSPEDFVKALSNGY